jgi:hypothetical protein
MPIRSGVDSAIDRNRRISLRHQPKVAHNSGFEAVVGIPSAPGEGIANGDFGPPDGFELVSGNVLGVASMKVEGFGNVANGGDFGEFEAEVIVFAIAKRGVNAADLIVDPATHEAKVKGHELDEEFNGVVGNLAAFTETVVKAAIVDDMIVGVDHADIGMGVEVGGGGGKGGRC